jgi:hypothetical protein
MGAFLLIMAGLAVTVGLFSILQSFRAKAMRALASKLGFQFINKPLPDSFSMICDPFDSNPSVWNVIEGQRNGIRILVFDSAFRKTYRTFIAVQTEDNPFSKDEVVLGNTLQSNGWTMSIQRIEDNLNHLRI